MSADITKIGNAMINAVTANSPRTKWRGDKLEFIPWWRSSDSMSGVVFPSRATWADVAGGGSGGGKDFAALFGLSLSEFLMRYSDTASAPAPRPVLKFESTWKAGEAAAVWAAHPCAGPEIVAWLRQKRGLPGVANSGVRLADPSLFPQHSAAWVAGVCADGGAALVPMRDPATWRVEGLVLRPLVPRRLKSLSVRGLSWHGPGCLVFGSKLAGVSGASSTVVVCEGAPDTWTAELLLAGRDDFCIVVGVNGVGSLPKLSMWLCDIEARVCVVPQADHINPRASSALVEVLRSLNLRAARLRWPVARGYKDINDVAKSWTGDWGVLAASFANAVDASLER